MAKYQRLYPGCFYHIYNRGNRGEILFREDRNFNYFLSLYGKYIRPIADTYCYCLLPNHFHFLVRIKEQESIDDDLISWSSRAFSNLFSTYTKAINQAFQRSGSLFEKPFKRKHIDVDRYLFQLVIYIHRNPQKHGLVKDFRDWTYSSYPAIIGYGSTRIQRGEVLKLFGGREGFVKSHSIAEVEGIIKIQFFDNMD